MTLPPVPPPHPSADERANADRPDPTPGGAAGTAATGPGGVPGGADNRARTPRPSLQKRLGTFTALLVGVAVTLTALAAYLTVSYQLGESVDDGLLRRAREAVATGFTDPSALVQQPAEVFLAADLRIALVTGGQAFAPRTPDGVVAIPPVGTPEVAVAEGTADTSVRTATVGGESFRTVAVPVRPGVALVFAQPTTFTDDLLTRLRVVSLLVGGVGVAIGAWSGVMLARTSLRPVRQLTVAAERIAQTGRLDPIDIGGEDELGRLAAAFNTMLRALDEARARQARLVADAGHELRTPLTSLRTNLELLAQSDGDTDSRTLPPADRAALLGDVRAQVDELTALVSDLVELSRDDSSPPVLERVDLADLVRDAVERVRRRAPGVRFTVLAEPWSVDVDVAAISRAVTNLLDNAAKHGPTHGEVTVTLTGGTLAVADEGNGIAPADRPYVFDRFYRSPEARGRPGSGLGLAIVRSAALRHGGAVEVGSAPGGGAVLRMTLPGASSAVHI